jgi:hypothetical protein
MRARDAVLGELDGYLAATIAAGPPADDMFDAARHLTPEAVAALDAETARRLRTGDEAGR